MATNGSFYWNELMTRDAEAAKKFYGATLGWTFEAMEQGDVPWDGYIAKPCLPDELVEPIRRLLAVS